MYKIIFLYIFAFIGLPALAQNKIKYGIGLEFSNNHLRGVFPEELTPYGHSGMQSNQRSNKTISPLVFVQKKIFNPKWAVQLGLGYAAYQHSFDFKYRHRFGSDINTTLNIRSHYLYIPIALSYDFRLNDKSSIIFQAGPRMNILLSEKDNFLDIILEEIYLSYKKFPISFSGYGSVGYQHSLKNKGLIQIKPFVNYELLPQLQGYGWGFYKNLKKAKNLQIGIGVSYLF